MTRPYRIALRLLLIGITIIAARMVVVTNIHQQLLASRNIVEAIKLRPDSAESRYQQALVWLPNKPEDAAARSRLAFEGSPTDARSLITLALGLERSGDHHRAAALMARADHLGPRMPDNQLHIAQFWERQGNTGEALKHLSVALDMKPAFRPDAYPLLLKIAQDRAGRNLLTPIMQNPPRWWHDFFCFALAQKISPEATRFLYEPHQKLPPPLADAEVAAYTERLINERAWVEAYFTWLNALHQEALGELGYLFNGGFEHKASESGFDWRINHDPRYQISNEETDLAGAGKGLAIRFTGTKPLSNQLVSQLMLIETGNYHLTGKLKSDDLVGGEGLRWTLICVDGGTLARTPLILGDHRWSRFDVDFTVPAKGCQAQKIQLEINPGSFNKLDYSGRVWFDDFNIKKY